MFKCIRILLEQYFLINITFDLLLTWATIYVIKTMVLEQITLVKNLLVTLITLKQYINKLIIKIIEHNV